MHFAAAWRHRCASLPREIATYFRNSQTSNLKCLRFNPIHARSHEFDTPITLSDHCTTLHRQCARYANLVVRFGHACVPCVTKTNNKVCIARTRSKYVFKSIYRNEQVIDEVSCVTETNNKVCISHKLSVEVHQVDFPTMWWASS